MDQIILPKKYFLTPFWDSTKFSLFCKVRTSRFSCQKFNFPKSVSNVVEMFLLMSGTNNFAKKYFLTPFRDSTKFSLFCKVRTCRYSVKNSIFQKCLKCCRNVSFDELNKLFCQKIFSYPILIVQNFHYFVRSAPVGFPSKIQFSKNCPNVVEMFFWWVEQIILPKNIFLPHFEIVQNFHYFVRSAPVNFPSKIQFSKNCLKCCRNVSFDEWNKLFCQKNIFLPHFEIVQNFHYFVRSASVDFRQKFNFPKSVSNVVEMFPLMSWTKNFAKKLFSYPILR